jgi:hypothetical protein
MDCIDLLHFVVEKLERFEFFYFTTEIIENMRQYAGLYETFECMFFSKINIWSESSERPPIETFDNKLLQLYHSFFTSSDNFFDYDYTVKNLIHVYETAQSLLDTHHHNVKYTQLLCALLKNVHKSVSCIDSYNPRHTVEDSGAMSLCVFDVIKNLYNKRHFASCLQLIKVYQTENGPVPYISWLQGSIGFEEKKDYRFVEQMHDALGDAYHVLQISEDNEVLKIFYEMHVYLTRARIIQKWNLDPRSYSGFPHVLLLEDVPKHFLCQTCFQHLHTMKTITTRPAAYNEYLDVLYKERMLNFTGVFQDFMIFRNNRKQFQENVYFYRAHKKFIHYIVRKKQSPALRFNIFVVVQFAFFKTDQLYDYHQFQEFMKNFDITTAHFGEKYAPFLRQLDERFKTFKELLEMKNFTLCVESNLFADVCMVCHDKVCDPQTATIQCRSCLKELGHASCIYEWLKVPGSKCPNCRS